MLSEFNLEITLVKFCKLQAKTRIIGKLKMEEKIILNTILLCNTMNYRMQYLNWDNINYNYLPCWLGDKWKQDMFLFQTDKSWRPPFKDASFRIAFWAWFIWPLMVKGKKKSALWPLTHIRQINQAQNAIWKLKKK